MDDIKLEYVPIEAREDFSITKSELEERIWAQSKKGLLENIVITPFNEALKADGKESYEKDFRFKVTRSEISPSPTEWRPVFEKLKIFLEIRADDSRAAKMNDLKYIEGIGYCISAKSVLDTILGYIKENTTHFSYAQMNWPKRKKDEFVRKIMFPQRDFSKVTKENAIICLEAKKFISSIEKEVVEAYKKINEDWLYKVTGYCREEIPPKEECPIGRLREIAPMKYISITMVREDKGNYDEVVKTIADDLQKMINDEKIVIRGGDAKRQYIVSKVKEETFVNIKRLYEISNSIFKLTPDVRYTIVP